MLEMTNNNRRKTLKLLSALTLLIVFSLPALGQNLTTANICYDKEGKETPCAGYTLPLTDGAYRVTWKSPTGREGKGEAVLTKEQAEIWQRWANQAFPDMRHAVTPPARKATQSNNGPGLMIAMGGTIGATSTGSPFSNAQTVAGGFVDGRASFKLFGATITGRMLTGVENGVRFAPGSTDAVLSFAPSMYMELPLSGDYGFLVGVLLDGQRVQGSTIMNPGMSFGLIRHTRDSVQTGTFTYLYDDVINNGIPQQFFRGYRGSFELQRWWGGVGFLAGVDGDRQAVPGLLSGGPQTQFKLRAGVGFRPKPVN